MWGSRGSSKKKGTGDMEDAKEMGGTCVEVPYVVLLLPSLSSRG